METDDDQFEAVNFGPNVVCKTDSIWSNQSGTILMAARSISQLVSHKPEAHSHLRSKPDRPIDQAMLNGIQFFVIKHPAAILLTALQSSAAYKSVRHQLYQAHLNANLGIRDREGERDVRWSFQFFCSNSQKKGFTLQTLGVWPLTISIPV